jgi:glycosyltransferase involved in cell wall biosynthesis
LEAQLGLQGKFVAAYVGTLGMAHGLGTILEAADRLKPRKDVAFVLVGTGAERAKLEADAKSRGLSNVHFVGAVSKTAVKDYWHLCDVALVLLRDLPLFAHVIPSKIYEAWGSARPGILGVRGESAGIVEKAAGGVVVPPENAMELAAALLRLADRPQVARELGAAGRAFVTDAYDRRKLAAEMLTALEVAVT